MKLTIVITSILIALAVGTILFWFFARATHPASTTTVETSSGLPISGNTTPTGSGTTANQGKDTMSVNGTDGNPIIVNDFLTDPSTSKDPANSGYYTLGYHPYLGVTDANTTTSPPYTITYIAATQYFNIALLQEPIGPTRTSMESFLMTDLGLSESQMCALNYSVSVPYWVNTSFTGRNLGFSFCPGATALPQ